MESALPLHRYGQDEVRDACRGVFGALAAKDGRLSMFDRSGVRTRYFSMPLEYHLAGASFEVRNRDFLACALPLAERCVRGCLEKSGARFGDVDHLISVTTTGLLTPSLEAHLAQTLPFSRTMKRTPLFGVGCAGGAVGLARAAELLEGNGSGTALLLSVELCSLTFRARDRSITQWVAATLFGDGAGAALLSARSAGPPGAQILGSQSLLLPDSLDVMGWAFDASGMRLELSPAAPRIIGRHVRGAAEGFLRSFGLTLGEVSVFLFHPGSASVLDACEAALGLSAEQLRHSRRFLAAHGNLSSASLLFILKDALEDDRPPAGSYALLGAFGPGFSCELSLLRFP